MLLVLFAKSLKGETSSFVAKTLSLIKFPCFLSLTYTLWLFNIAMDKGFSMAMLNNQRVVLTLFFLYGCTCPESP